MKCRFCKTALKDIFIDLGNAPASNSYITEDALNQPETYFPLKIFVCHKCFLVQVDEYKKTETIFNEEYAYFSSYSQSWLAHSKRYVDMMTERFGYDDKSQVIELASNDGYLLQYFKEKGVPVLGIEPASNTAKVAIEKGIPTITEFFGEKLAKDLAAKGIKADLLLGNNVLAHVPDLLDFLKGAKIVLKKDGVITYEFPHLMKLVENNQFDTIYHEHFSYFSFTTISKVFQSVGLELFDVEEIPTHGGSIRIFGKHKEDSSKKSSPRVKKMLDVEKKKGMTKLSYYTGFGEKAIAIKLDLLEFLMKQKKAGKKVGAWGAAAKGNTLLNFAGVKNDLVDFVVDLNPHKQGKYMPGSHIPIVDEAHLKRERPDFIFILPWNIKDEIISSIPYVKKWKARFVTAIPGLKII